MIRRFIRMNYKFPSKKAEITFEVESFERTYLIQKTDEVINGLSIDRHHISTIELLEIHE